MAVNLSPVGGVAAQFFDNNGNVLTGGKLFTYAAGTTTPVATFTSSLGTTAHTNPIVLDAAGRVPNGGEIWLTDGVTYKFVLQTSTSVLIATYDNITGINSNFVNFTAEQEIQTATAGQTVFNLTTMQYQPGTNSLTVYVDGVNQYGPGALYAYLETDSDTVTFVSGLHVGASVKFTTAVQATGNATNASVVTYDPPFAGGVATNVEDKLAQTVSVMDFGAVGDGVTDDTAAIQNAISAAALAMQPLYFGKAKSYLVTGQLTIPNTAELDFNGSTIILGYNATATAISCGNDVSIKNGTIQVPVTATQERIITTGSRNNLFDLLITSVNQQNNRTDNSDAAIRIVGNDCVVENVRVVNFDNAFSTENADHCTLISLKATSYVRGVWVNDCDYCNVVGLVTETRSANATQSPGHNGLLVTQTRWSSFNAIQIINAGEHGIRIGGSTTYGSRALTFGDVLVEKPGQCGFKIRDETNRTTDVQINGLMVLDCSFGGGSSLNEDALRVEKADHVVVTGMSSNVRDGGTSAYDGIHIYDSTDVTVVTPRIEDVARDGIRITDSDGATETGLVNSIYIISPQIFDANGNGVTISSQTEALRDIYVTNASIRQQTGYGVLIEANGTITQPVQVTGIVNSEGSGVFNTNNNDSQLYVDLKLANQTSVINTLTIASGAVTLPTRQAVGLYYIDTEGAGASDDLDNLNGGATYGQIVILSAIDSARTVVVKDGTGNMRLAGDFSMDNADDKITLVWNGSVWFELARSDNAA